MMRKKWVVVAALAVIAAGAGCSGDDDDDHEDDPFAEGCEHMAEGPNTEINATATSSGAPAIDNDHMRYDITLPGTSAGFVSYASSDALETYFFLSAGNTFELRDASGVVQTPEESGGTGDCSEVQAFYLYDLGVGTYLARIGPLVGSSSLSIVVEGHAH